jgi:PAS domain S-box-containing protein
MITILVVDDNPGDLLYLCKILNNKEYNTIPLNSGEHALIAIEEHNPDLILLDIQMPDNSGLEVCTQIKQKERLKEIPVIFLTASTETSKKLEGLNLGAVDYITKPFEKEELLAKVKTHLNIFILNKTLKKQTDELKLKNKEYSALNEEYISINKELLKYKAEIEETEKRYKTIFKNTNTIMLVIDPDSGIIIDANKAALNFYGYSYKEICKLNINQINILTSKEIKKEMFFANDGSKSIFYFKHKLSNNKIRDVEVYCSKILLGNKRLLLSIIHDITERKEADQALINNEKLLQKISDNYPNSYISIIEKDLKIGFCAGQEFKKLGLNPKDYIGLSLDQIFGKNTPFIKSEYLKAFKGEICSFELFIFNQHQYYQAIPLYENDEINRILIVVENISKRKKIEMALLEAKKEAEEANLAKSKFLSNMSHELRTPLNSILGFSQLLKEDQNLNADQQDQIDTVLKSGQHLLDLINDILDISKIEAGKQELYISDFSLPDLIKDVINITKINADEKNLYFYCNTVNNIPEIVNGDKRKVKQILLNLLSNAVKYTNKGGINFYIEAKRGKKSKIIFRIEDSGFGISEEDKKSIFKPFNQLGKNYNNGTGLGLFITEKLTKLINGKLLVSSTPNKGSCFTAEIPLVVISNATSRIENNQIPTHTLEGKKQIAIKIPELTVLNEILKQTKIGDYDKLEEIINKLKTEDEEYNFFCEKIKNFLKKYNEKAIIDYINILKSNIK